jgi:hypothetical protein
VRFFTILTDSGWKVADLRTRSMRSLQLELDGTASPSVQVGGSEVS